MSESKTTPGPWEVGGIAHIGNCTSLDYPILDDNGSCVAHVIFNEVGGDDGDQCRADATLIASAPDLLAALKALLTAEMMHETAMSHNDESAVEAANEAKWPAVDAAHAAIAKAEGRES